MKRLITLDIIKNIAIIFVVMNHLLFLYAAEKGCFMYTINTILAYIGVPLFMCTNGALILKKDFSNIQNIKRFYQHNLLTIVITGELWIIVYYFIKSEVFSLKDFLFCISFINKPENHLWFLRMIILYYIAMPVIIYLFKQHKNIFSFIAFCTFCLTFAYNGYLIYKGTPIPTTSGLSYSCYLIYLLGGYYISIGKTRNLNGFIIFLIFIISIFGLFYTHYNNNYMIWYDNPFILLISLSLFDLIYRGTMNIHNTQHNTIALEKITDISMMTFGIYLSHILFIIPLRDIKFTNITEVNLFYYALTLLILLCSILLIKITKRINSKLSYLLFRY